jgi:hypothetical protein
MQAVDKEKDELVENVARLSTKEEGPIQQATGDPVLKDK